MSETPPAPLHIVLTFDDNYWAPAYATMRSVCLKSHRRNDLVFHLFHRPLAPEHIADLKEIEVEFGARLVFHDLAADPAFRDLVATIPHDRRLTDIVYARLMLDRLLPADVARVVYLDCDLLVLAPIEELFALDLATNALAAVRDPNALRVANGRDARANRDYFDPADPYFNAGLLVIDMAAWRDTNVLARVLEMREQGILERLYYDQGALNVIFKGRIKALPGHWNVTDPQPAHQMLDPVVLHYTGVRKPWQIFSRVGHARLYRHVMTNPLFYRYRRHRWRIRLRERLGGKPRA